MDTNLVVLSGNLTRDVEVKYSGEGKALAKFSLACGYGWGDKKGTSFFDCTAFGKTAEACGLHLHKGDRVTITGKLRQERWDSKEGEKKSKIAVLVDAVEFVRVKGKAPEDAATQEETPPQAASGEDIPF